MVRQYEYQPCVPTRGTKVPAGPDWLHEIKHDGYRLIVQREDKRVRLFTRNGHDWSQRYPLITEAALRIKSTSFVIDGEAVLLGVDGISDFEGGVLLMPDIPCGKYIGNSAPPADEAEHFMKCPDCGCWVDCRDLRAVFDHAKPLPH